MADRATIEDTGRIALSRNEVTSADAGGRAWHGTFQSWSDMDHTDFDTRVLFLDWNGHPVGEVRRRAARLAPGETVHVRVALPAAASMIQVDRLHWRTGDATRTVLGPDRPWPFGYVPDR